MKSFVTLMVLFASVPAFADSCKVWIRSEPAAIPGVSRSVEFQASEKDALNEAYVLTTHFMNSFSEQSNVVTNLVCEESGLNVKLQILK